MDLDDDYTEIKRELNYIKNKTITPSDSNIKKKLALLRCKNFDLYETFIIQYNTILENLIITNKENIVNIMLDNIKKYGFDSLSELEVKMLYYYTSGYN